MPPAALNKSPHGSTSASSGGLYPPSNVPSNNASGPPSLQQQRSPAGPVPSPSPSGPMASSISPHSNSQNPNMNKASTPQPMPPHLPSMPQQQAQHRSYLPPQAMMQQHNRSMNGTGMEHPMNPSAGQPPSSYMPGQPPYMPQQQQQPPPPHGYPVQQNGYAHHPNGGMGQQHYSMYHQQQSNSSVRVVLTCIVSST